VILNLTVVRGDTLFDVAQRFYGDGTEFPIIPAGRVG
jgi:nucleoid-associated protein YgaU